MGCPSPTSGRWRGRETISKGKGFEVDLDQGEAEPLNLLPTDLRSKRPGTALRTAKPPAVGIDRQLSDQLLSHIRWNVISSCSMDLVVSHLKSLQKQLVAAKRKGNCAVRSDQCCRSRVFNKHKRSERGELIASSEPTFGNVSNF